MGIKVSGVDFRLINMTNEGLLAEFPRINYFDN